MSVTDHTLRPVLRDVLDARGSNLAQARLLFNATPEVDSLIELVHTLPVDLGTKRLLLTYCSDLLTLNADEGEHERQAAGILDAAVAALRHAATVERQTNPFTVKALARRLRPPLAIIANAGHHDALAFVTAVRTIDEVVAVVPVSQLLTPSVRNQLGPNRYQLLEQLVEQRVAA
jgi:hypothetical protein